MVAEHEIVNLPSVSVLDEQRRETSGRVAAAKAVAVIADPVYQSRDLRIKAIKAKTGRVKSTSSNQAADLSVVTRSARDVGLINFRRLRFSRREADQITGLFPPTMHSKIVDFDASRANLARTDLGQFRILHFATHGFLNTKHPELSGIVLSLYDEQGQSQDGFLRTHEIYNLKLGADLVVLSACQTALGKDVRGEGLIGLARGFMYAGTPRIVASLWKVDDRATSELMKRFYQGVLGPARLPPAVALREAQLSIWKQKQWRAPYYWAAFVLQGEWR